MGFHGEALLAPRPTPKMEDHPSSAVRDCLFNLFAATLHIGGRSSIRNLRTRHAVVTGTHLTWLISLLGTISWILLRCVYVCVWGGVACIRFKSTTGCTLKKFDNTGMNSLAKFEENFKRVYQIKRKKLSQATKRKLSHFIVSVYMFNI